MTTMLEKAARALFDKYVRLSGTDAAQNYAKLGPSGPAAVAIRMALQHGLT